MKRIIFAFIILFALASIVSSVSSIYQLLHKRDLLIAAQQALERVQKQNVGLKNRLKIVSGPGFIEEEARNKLYFVKPGESTVYIAKNLVVPKIVKVQKPQEKTNWQQWIDLFL